MHLRSRMPAWVGWHAWRKMPAAARPRLVTTVHGFYSVGRYSSVMTRGERVIAVSNSICQYITQNYPDVRPENIKVIPRGVDEASINEALDRIHHGARRGRRIRHPPTKVLTMVGRLTRLKGHEDFIQLIAALQQKGISVRGVVVGGEHPTERTMRRTYARAPLLCRLHSPDIGRIYGKSCRSLIWCYRYRRNLSHLGEPCWKPWL